MNFFYEFISNYYLIHHFGIYGAMITAALTPFIYLVINYCFAKYVVKDYEIPCRFFLLPGLFMCAAVALYYVLLPFMLLRYGIVPAGVCAHFPEVLVYAEEKGLLKKDNPAMLAFSFTAPISALIHLCDREHNRRDEAFERMAAFVEYFISIHAAE